MTTATLNFGVIGRCACGCIGRRRSTFADEPICDACLPSRTSFLRVIDPRDHDLVVTGQLTPAQRRARVAFLQGSYEREAQLIVEREEFKRGVLCPAA